MMEEDLASPAIPQKTEASLDTYRLNGPLHHSVS
jgi:hypothetical protein